MMKLNKPIAAAALMLIALSCEDEQTSQLKPLDDSPVFMDFPVEASGRMGTDSRYAVYKAEYIVADGADQVGRTVYFSNVGNKQLSEDFVAGVSFDGTDNVSYYIDETRPSDELAVALTSGAISRAMNTWDEVTCSNLGMFKIPSNNAASSGYVSALLGYGGSFAYFADVVHAGWLPAGFFDMIALDGSEYILGVTFTLLIVDQQGNFTDLDGNGKYDVAWREIYYNDAFPWAVNGGHYDVETIALHEAGHGLSQAHFGKAFSTGNGKIHFSPRAVMNAAYSGIQRDIRATDNGGHCSLWGNWPSN